MKRPISINSQHSKRAPDGACRKRSVEGMSMPMKGVSSHALLAGRLEFAGSRNVQNSQTYEKRNSCPRDLSHARRRGRSFAGANQRRSDLAHPDKSRACQDSGRGGSHFQYSRNAGARPKRVEFFIAGFQSAGHLLDLALQQYAAQPFQSVRRPPRLSHCRNQPCLRRGRPIG